MDVKGATFISTFVLILISLIGGIVTQGDPQSASFVNCSFEDGMCDWESISAGWKIGQGSPTTSGTGSAHDQTLRNASRIYVYLDPKSVNTSQSQVLQSLHLPWNESCLSLWYHICGNDTGNLTVSIEAKNTTTATKFSTTQSGNKTILWNEEGKLDDKWHSVEITIRTQEAFRVLLVETTKRQNGVIAVDDIQLSKCCCKDNCGFGFCNWIQKTSDATYGASFSRTTGQQSGRTNKTTHPSSGRTNKTTDPPRGLTNKTTDPPSGSTNKTSDPQNGSTKKTTDPQSGRTNKATDPPSGRTTKTTDRPSGRTKKTTGSQRDLTNKTTDPQSGRKNKTTDPQNGRTNKTTDPPSGRTNKTTDPPSGVTNKTDEVITASLVGTVMFVVLSLLVGFCVCRKRRRHRKMVEPFELQPIASKPSSRDDERGYSSSAANCINPGYIYSSKASRSGNKALINGKTDDANYKYASAFQSTTPAQWTDDTYDNTSDETKPHFDGAYDHIPTHFVEEYDAIHLTTRTRLDASETYDQVIICPDDVYDDTCVAQASTIQYKSYDRVTKGTCETHVSKPNISNSQDNIYEFVA